ncbi:MAG: hypothetical protein WBZ36_23535, partial [Candidatus Nitrosopolaris sp.]
QGYFGSLLLAMYNEKGELVFVGHSGSGFDFDTLGKIYEKLEQIKSDSCPIRYVPYTNRDPVLGKTRTRSYNKTKFMIFPCKKYEAMP